MPLNLIAHRLMQAIYTIEIPMAYVIILVTKGTNAGMTDEQRRNVSGKNWQRGAWGQMFHNWLVVLRRNSLDTEAVCASFFSESLKVYLSNGSSSLRWAMSWPRG
jgi:hypothetical protein